MVSLWPLLPFWLIPVGHGLVLLGEAHPVPMGGVAEDVGAALVTLAPVSKVIAITASLGLWLLPGAVG